MEDIERQEEFINEMVELCRRHAVRVDEHDSYDGSDSYCGTEYSFFGDGIDVEMPDLMKKINSSR